MFLEKSVVDNGTGEIVNVMYSGDRILRGKSVEYLENHPIADSDAEYAKLWSSSARVLSYCSYLSTTARVCLRLVQYIRFESGVLAYSNGHLLDMRSILSICGDMHENSVRGAVNTLVSDGVFAKVTKEPPSRYLVNPYVFMRGKRVNRTLIELFKDSKWAAANEGLFSK